MAPTHDRFGLMKTVHQTILIGLTDSVYAAFEFYIYFRGIFIIATSKKYCIFFKIVALFLFIAQKIKTAEVIKYTKRKLYLWEKKDANFVWEPRRAIVC